MENWGEITPITWSDFTQQPVGWVEPSRCGTRGTGDQGLIAVDVTQHGGLWKMDENGYTWVFPKIGVPKMDGLYMETPIKVDDLGVPLFLETPTWKGSDPIGNGTHFSLNHDYGRKGKHSTKSR